MAITELVERARGGDRGAALVEFALVVPLLLLLVFGTFEVGMAWRDFQTVTQAARAGARATSQLGVDPDADAEALRAIEAGLGSLADSTDRIVIYRADKDGSIPNACRNRRPPGIPGRCSVYDRDSFDDFVQGSWAPDARDNRRDKAEHVGVSVQISRESISGMVLDRTFTISDRVVMRVEPNAGD